MRCVIDSSTSSFGGVSNTPTRSRSVGPATRLHFYLVLPNRTNGAQ
jgi:hypothetical protein